MQTEITGQSAVEALPEFAEKEDERAIAGVFARLEHADEDVRRAAVKVLPELAEKGDERAIAGVCARLEDADWRVRRAAVEVLPKLAEKSDERAIAGVCVRLEDVEILVRSAAVKVLPELAEKGDERAIAGVCVRLEDAYWRVRRAAVKVLPKLAEKGDDRVIAGVCARLEHADEDVRRAAVNVLPEFAEKGDERAIAGVCARLEDADEDVRRAAKASLPRILQQLDIAAAVSALENNATAGLRLQACDLGVNITCFALALKKNTSVKCIDLTDAHMSGHDALAMASAVEANISLTSLVADDDFLIRSPCGRRIRAALSRNKLGLQVLTVHLSQLPNIDQLAITCTTLGGDAIAKVELPSTADLMTLDAEIARQTQHLGVRSLVLADGSLVGCPLQMPEVLLSELLQRSGHV